MALARFSPSRSPFPGTQLLCVVLHSPQNNQPIILTKNHIPATIQYITLSLSKANTPPLPLRQSHTSDNLPLLPNRRHQKRITNHKLIHHPLHTLSRENRLHRTGNRLTSNFRTLYSLENLRQTFLSERQRSLTF